MDEIAERYAPKIKVFKFTPRVSLYDIRGFPTLVIYSGGQKVETVDDFGDLNTFVRSDTLSKAISKYI